MLKVPARLSRALQDVLNEKQKAALPIIRAMNCLAVIEINYQWTREYGFAHDLPALARERRARAIKLAASLLKLVEQHDQDLKIPMAIGARERRAPQTRSTSGSARYHACHCTIELIQKESTMSNTTLMMPIAMGEQAIGVVLVPVTLPQAWKDVLLERRAQVEQHGHTTEYDDRYRDGKLEDAAAAVASTACMSNGAHPTIWPWSWDYFKMHIQTKTYRQRLVIAAALLLAAIERLDRKEEKK